MGIWIFMIIIALPIPLIMIGFGKAMLTTASEEISDWFGYRTELAKKNKNTWAFAQKYYGRLLYKPGYFFLVLNAVVMAAVFGKGEDAASIAGGTVVVVTTLYLLVAIIPTQIAMHKTFHKDGSYREENRKK